MAQRVEERPGPKIDLQPSRQLGDWMAEHRLSLGFTTYQAGLLFLIGLQPDGRFRFFNRSFPRCMGLWADGQALWMSSLYQLWRFENALPPGETHEGYDRQYVPRVAYSTGDLDIHDIAVDGDGRVVFVNTLYSCLATVSDRHSFVPLWKPPFISKIAAEDRCHLNGMAMADGRPVYVTAISRSDAPAGWRDRRDRGGCLVDVGSGEVVVAGLSMPHSPRVHRDRPWLLESGTGFFGSVDVGRGRFEPTAFCPGYLRGLAFAGNFAVAGLSKCRRERSFSGLKLQDTLAERDVEARCGLVVIDLRSGDIVHWLWIEGDIEELYDVIVLPGVVQPMALGVVTDEIRRAITIGEPPESDGIDAFPLA
jgi:uncharacterized protein (TIGR03032 family)